MKHAPDELVRFAGWLADESAAIVKRLFRSGISVELKPDGSPVTLADRQAEAAIRRLIGTAYPEHGVIGEEYGEDRPESEFVWVLDPIDGTKSFITGRPTFGTLIALLHESRPLVGIIDHPALGAGERWVGAVGHPTQMNGSPVHTRPCPEPGNAALFASSPHAFVGDAEAAFGRVRAATRQVLYGSDCYGFGLIASGFADLQVDAQMGIHDYLAAVPVVEGAGGIMTDWSGRRLTLASGDRTIAAGDPRLQQQVLAMLSSA
jgi:inositol-phosphate phosphatase/L-galactose 1-phosphate phosphatase/histidinol-phosphatase